MALVLVQVSGNTYQHKEELKAIGLSFNRAEKCWEISVPDDEVDELVSEIEDRTDDRGVVVHTKSP